MLSVSTSIVDCIEILDDTEEENVMIMKTNNKLCFMCDKITNNNSVSLKYGKTTHTKTDLPDKLGELIGDEFIVFVSVDDKLCIPCTKLINRVDKLELELKNCKDKVTDQLKYKYQLTDDILINGENGNCNNRPKFEKGSVGGIMDEVDKSEIKKFQDVSKDKSDIIIEDLKIKRLKFEMVKNKMFSGNDNPFIDFDCDDDDVCILDDVKVSDMNTKIQNKNDNVINDERMISMDIDKSENDIAMKMKCNSCDFKTNTEMAFKHHQTNCYFSDNIRCILCNRLCESDLIFCEHFLNDHCVERIKCHVCCKSTVSVMNSSDNLDTVEEDFVNGSFHVCKHCFKFKFQNIILNINKKNSESKESILKVNVLVSNNIKVESNVIKKIKPINIICKYCCFKTKCKSTFDKHIKQCKNDNKTILSKRLVNDITNMVNINKMKLTESIDIGNEQNYEKLHNDSEIIKFRNNNNNNKSFKCNICSELFIDKMNLILHLKNHKLNSISTSNGTTYTSNNVRTINNNNNNNMNLNPQNNENFTNNVLLFYCEKCGINFNEESVFVNHKIGCNSKKEIFFKTIAKQETEEVEEEDGDIVKLYFSNVNNHLSVSTNQKLLKSDLNVDYSSNLDKRNKSLLNIVKENKPTPSFIKNELLLQSDTDNGNEIYNDDEESTEFQSIVNDFNEDRKLIMNNNKELNLDNIDSCNLSGISVPVGNLGIKNYNYNLEKSVQRSDVSNNVDNPLVNNVKASSIKDTLFNKNIVVNYDKFNVKVYSENIFTNDNKNLQSSYSMNNNKLNSFIRTDESILKNFKTVENQCVRQRFILPKVDVITSSVNVSNNQNSLLTGSINAECEWCNICNKYIDTNEGKEEHIRKHETLRCHNCNFETKYKNVLKLHLRKHNCNNNSNRNYKIKNSFSYTCALCKDISFKSKRLLKFHEMSHLENYKFRCDKCNEKFMKEKQLKNHYSNSHRDPHCKHCGKEIFNLRALKNHERRHIVPGSNTNVLQCDKCNRTFKTRTGLRHHFATHTGVFKYFCEFCKRGFMSKMILEEHRRSHTKEDRYICDVCGKKFKFQSTYWIHRKWHDNPFPYKCNFCGRLFKHTSLLAVHKRKHTGERPYRCPYCPLNFAVGGTLKRHIILHTQKFPFNCDKCKRGFTTRHKYNVHLAKAHNDYNLLNKSVTNRKRKDFKVVIDECVAVKEGECVKILDTPLEPVVQTHLIPSKPVITSESTIMQSNLIVSTNVLASNNFNCANKSIGVNDYVQEKPVVSDTVKSNFISKLLPLEPIKTGLENCNNHIDKNSVIEIKEQADGFDFIQPNASNFTIVNIDELNETGSNDLNANATLIPYIITGAESVNSNNNSNMVFEIIPSTSNLQQMPASPNNISLNLQDKVILPDFPVVFY